MIAIVDYGMGNIGSVFNMMRKLHAKAKITHDLEEIKAANKIILPGVGHFDRGMTCLKNSGLIDALNEHALVRKKPILGICLGMQIMTRGSEEGSLSGLGWIAGDTIKFLPQKTLKIPHMGWNYIKPSSHSRLFLESTDESERFYFVHNYYVKLDNPIDTSAYCRYGENFAAAFEVGNIMGVQFHPEKSHIFGMNLFKRFIAL